eukprot:15484980-Alexandrium_andersonii.AAC.1
MPQVEEVLGDAFGQEVIVDASPAPQLGEPPAVLATGPHSLGMNICSWQTRPWPSLGTSKQNRTLATRAVAPFSAALA